MDRWEYFTTVFGPYDAANPHAATQRASYLNSLGNDGWELVGVVPLQSRAHSRGSEHEGFFGGEYQHQEEFESTTLYEAFFKRRRQAY